MKHQLLRYWLALNASAFDAAVHACAAFFGVAGIHCAIDTVPALNLKQLAAVFAISFLRGALKYLDTHPLTELERGLSQSAARVSADTPVDSNAQMSGEDLRVETTRGPSPASTTTTPNEPSKN